MASHSDQLTSGGRRTSFRRCARGGYFFQGSNRVDGEVGARGDGVLEQGVDEGEEEEALADEDVETVARAQEAIDRLIEETEEENE